MIDRTVEKALYPQRQVNSVLGNIANDTSLLSGLEYPLDSNDFVMSIQKVIFKTISNLVAENNIHEITPVTIDNYLKPYPTNYATWQKDGAEYLQQIKELAERSTYESDAKLIKKYSLLRRLEEEGVSVQDLFDYTTTDLKQLDEQAEKINELDMQDILEHYTSRLMKVREEIGETSGNNVRFEAKDDIDSLLERLNNDPVMGYPFSNSAYNGLFRGMRAGKYMLRSATSGGGKAVALDTKIPTPSGEYILAKDVKIGTELLSRQGKPTKVTGVYLQKPTMLYKVTTEDGRVQILHPDHLVPYYDKDGDIINAPLSHIMEYYSSTIYNIPLLANAIDYPAVEHDISPKEFVDVLDSIPYAASREYLLGKSFLVDSIDNRIALFNAFADKYLYNNYNGKNFMTIDNSVIYDYVLDLMDGLGIKHYEYGLDTFAVDFMSKGTMIVSIESYHVAKSVCFTVDNDEHLFLINNFMVTHNTRLSVKDMINVAMDEIYVIGKGWQKTNTNFPTLFISTELNKDELQTIILAYLTGLTTTRIEEGNFNAGEKERLDHAIEVIKRSKMYFEYIEDFSVSDVQMTIEDYVNRYDVNYVVFDYIQNSPKMSRTAQDSFGHNLREDEILQQLSRNLKRLAEKYDIFILSATQLNAEGQSGVDNESSRTSASLRGSKAVADKIDYGIVSAHVRAIDLKKLDPVLKEVGIDKKPTFGHFVYKNRAGLTGVIIWTKINLGNMREDIMFITDYNYQLIEDVKLIEGVLRDEQLSEEEDF